MDDGGRDEPGGDRTVSRVLSASAAASVAAVLTVLSPLPAAAQVDSALLGQRVQVHVRDVHRQAEFAPKEQVLRGTVTRVDSAGVTLLVPSVTDVVSIPRQEMVRLAVSRGVPNRGESALRGLFGGAVVGAFWGLVYHSADLGESGDTWQDAAGGGAVIGAMVGAVMGAVSPHERWRRIRLR